MIFIKQERLYLLEFYHRILVKRPMCVCVYTRVSKDIAPDLHR